MRINAVIQARAGSTRLPAKVLADLGGRPVLGWVVRAARAASLVDEVIVATSTLTGDDVVADLAESLGARVVRGSEDDVLSRFVAALDAYPADALTPQHAIRPILDGLRALRFMDETFYLRAGSINIFNGMISLTFSCDGSHYMSYVEFLLKDTSFWF